MDPDQRDRRVVRATRGRPTSRRRMYKLDDFRPYLYKTTDYGKTWTKITNGIPDGAFTRVVREDPVRRACSTAGTETRPLRLLRRRRELAAVPAQPALHADHRPRRQERRPRRRHAGPRVLDPRRPDGAAEVERRGRRLRRVSLPAAADGAHGRRGAGRRGRRAPRRPDTNMPAGVVVDYWLKDDPRRARRSRSSSSTGDTLLRSFSNQKPPKADGPEGGGRAQARRRRTRTSRSSRRRA